MSRDKIVHYIFWPSIFLYVSVAYLSTVPTWEPTLTYRLYFQSISGVVESPYNQRILVPYLIYFYAGLMPRSFLTGYSFLDLGSTLIMLPLIYAWLRKALRPGVALLGVASIVLLLPLMFTWWIYSASTPIEMLFFLWGLFWICRIGRKETSSHFAPWVICLLIAGSMLNRNSGPVLIILAYLLIRLPHWRKTEYWRWAIIYGGLIGVMTLALYAVRPYAPMGDSWIGQANRVMAFNLDPQNLHLALKNNAPLLGLLLIALVGVKTASGMNRRLLWILPVYLPMVAMVGNWQEVRLWLPVLPLILNIALGEIERVYQLHLHAFSKLINVIERPA